MTEELKKQDPFTPEVVKFECGNEKLELKPLPLSKLKEALVVLKTAFSLVQAAAKEDPLAVINQVPDLVLEKFTDLAPIVLARPDLSKEWWVANMSLPLARHILVEAARVNGVEDFLDLSGLKPKKKAMTESPASPSSTIL